MFPEISIIVPLYNASAFIGDCISSILNQSYSDFELILVDDGSIDDSLQICRQFAETDSRVRCFHKTNGGHMDALNFGVSKSRGKWLSFCDHDDTIPNEAIETLMNLSGDDTNIIVGFSYDGNGQCYDISPDIWLGRMIHGDPILCTRWAKLYKHSLFTEDTFKLDRSIIVGEDMLMNIKIAFINTLPIKVINKKVYNYKQLPTSQSVLYKWTDEKYYNLYSNLSDTMSGLGIDDSYRQYLVQNLAGMLRDLRLHYPPHKIRLKNSKLQVSAVHELKLSECTPALFDFFIIFFPDSYCLYLYLMLKMKCTILFQYISRVLFHK